MNWKLIAKYAVGLMLAGIIIGFVDASARPTEPVAVMAMTVSGYLMLLGVYMAIFMRMAVRQQDRPLLHGLLATGIACAASFAVLLALSKGSALISPVSILLELAVSFVALVAGIRIGRRHRISRTAGDA